MGLFQEHDTSDSNQNCIRSRLQSATCPRLFTSISFIFGALISNSTPSNFHSTTSFKAFVTFISVKVGSAYNDIIMVRSKRILVIHVGMVGLHYELSCAQF